MYFLSEKSKSTPRRVSLDIESHSEEFDDSEGLLHGNKASNLPKPSRSPLLVPVLLIIIGIQLVMIFYLKAEVHKQTTSPNGLSLRRTETRTLYQPSRYTSPNETEADEAWSAILAGHGIVSIPRSYALQQDLPDSVQLNDGSGNRIYAIEAYHAMHCTAITRKHYMALDRGINGTWSRPHDVHCFDTLRQYIMCNVDDTLLWSTGHRDVGHGQKKKCHNWDALRDWAEERSVGYFDAEPGPGVKHMGNYHAGDGLPVGSFY